MTLSLSKPAGGSVGWGNSINQNFTDIENYINSGSLIPTGAVQAYAGGTPPSGWLACDGSPVSRTTYADLFAAIGTTWGAGDGSTTFNVPDLRGRTLIGDGTGSGLTARTLGDTLGAETHQLTESEMPSHNHVAVMENGSIGVTSYRFDAAAIVINNQSTTTRTGPVASAGSDAAHNNMQPSAVVKWLIKT